MPRRTTQHASTSLERLNPVHLRGSYQRTLKVLRPQCFLLYGTPTQKATPRLGEWPVICNGHHWPPIIQTFHPSKVGFGAFTGRRHQRWVHALAFGKDLSASSTSLRTLPRAIHLPKHNDPKAPHFSDFAEPRKDPSPVSSDSPDPASIFQYPRSAHSLTPQCPQPIIQIHSDKSPPRTSPLCFGSMETTRGSEHRLIRLA